MSQLWAGGPQYTDDKTFKITTDSVLLANFAGADFTRCMDLGCGGGIIGVLLAAANPGGTVDGVDIRQEAASVAQQNYRVNGIRGTVRCLDMREHRALGEPGSCDMVVCNPPYYYGGKVSPDPERAAARGGTLSPAQFCGAASFLLKKGGSFCLVHKPEFLTDIFSAMRLADIEPKRMRLVAHKADSAPALVLLAGRRGGRPGLAALPTLVLCHDDGTPTEEVRRIYHMRGAT